MRLLAFDPGKQGAVCLMDTVTKGISFQVLPHTPEGDVDFDKVCDILMEEGPDHIFLEKASGYSMGAKHAFTYGRGFMALEIAIKLSEIPVTYIEPSRWAKQMHLGINNNLKPKVKSAIAVKRLFPKIFKTLPKMGKGKHTRPHEGIVDAILICQYGRDSMQPSSKI